MESICALQFCDMDFADFEVLVLVPALSQLAFVYFFQCGCPNTCEFLTSSSGLKRPQRGLVLFQAVASLQDGHLCGLPGHPRRAAGPLCVGIHRPGTLPSVRSPYHRRGTSERVTLTLWRCMRCCPSRGS